MESWPHPAAHGEVDAPYLGTTVELALMGLGMGGAHGGETDVPGPCLGIAGPRVLLGGGQ